jgi:hypothetical protein
MERRRGTISEAAVLLAALALLGVILFAVGVDLTSGGA